MIDLDELIIPYKKDTLTELIAGKIIMIVMLMVMMTKSSKLRGKCFETLEGLYILRYLTSQTYQKNNLQFELASKYTLTS